MTKGGRWPDGSKLIKRPRTVDMTEHLGLVMHIVRQYQRKHWVPAWLDEDDLFQEGCIGLDLACRGYDGAVAKFSTYAGRAIWRQIDRVVRRAWKKTGTEFSIKQAQFIEAPHQEPYAHRDEAEAFRDVWGRLTDCEKQLAYERYVERRSLREIGERRGVSGERIRQRLRALLPHLELRVLFGGKKL